VEFGSARDLLGWLVDVWESGPPRSGKLARGDFLIELAVAEAKIPEASIGTFDDFSQWVYDLRTGAWIIFDESDAERVRFPGELRRSRNDVILSRNFIPTAVGATWVKSSLTASSVGRVAVDLASLIILVERSIEDADAPEETKEEARRLLSKVGDAAASGAAADLIVRLVFAIVNGLR